MQLLPRYLVKNKVDILLSKIGFITEYKPVYQRTLNIYKGIDNTIQFRLINADQKPVDLTPYTPIVVAYDNAQNLIFERAAVVTDDGVTIAKRGMFHITFTDADTRNKDNQYLTYSVYLVDKTTGEKIISYANSHFEAPGIIQLKDGVYPSPKGGTPITHYTKIKVNNVYYWVSDAIEVAPGLNSNEALSTIAVYTNGYVGKLTVEGSLDPQISVPTYWATIIDKNITAQDTGIVPVNFTGVYVFVRIKFDQDPTTTITKALIKT